MSAEKKLRLAGILVQPIFMYDDGDELTPGPQVQAIQLRPAELSQFAENLPNLIAEVEAKAAEQLATQEAAGGDAKPAPKRNGRKIAAR